MRAATTAERCAAAQAAGFAGIGANLTVDPHDRSGAAAKVPILEVEAVRLDDLSRLDTAVALVRRDGAHHVQVIPPFHGSMPAAALAEAMDAVAAAVAPALVSIEFLPYTCVPDIPTASSVVSLCRAANVGICVDSWHVVRGAGIAQLADLDPALVTSIQLDDGSLVSERPVTSIDEYVVDCMTTRLPPGEGAFDLDRFLAAVLDPRPDLPVSIEVISTELDALPPMDVAQRLMTAATALLDSRR
jgi:sugar phosphate isomerase/epimerase